MSSPFQISHNEVRLAFDNPRLETRLPLLRITWQGLRLRKRSTRVPCAVRLLAVNSARETRWEDGIYVDSHRWSRPPLVGKNEWRRRGWLMADGSLPFGDLDAVDPELAQFDYLPPCHSRPPSTVPHNWM